MGKMEDFDKCLNEFDKKYKLKEVILLGKKDDKIRRLILKF